MPAERVVQRAVLIAHRQGCRTGLVLLDDSIIARRQQPRNRMKPSRSRSVDIRGLRYHLREWGSDDAPLW